MQLIQLPLFDLLLLQGYLSEYLHQKHGFRILALECDDQRVQSAKERQKKLFPKSINDVKYVSHFITESSMDFIKERITTEFNIPGHVRIVLIGLHACGDLSVTALKLATNESCVKGLVIMPCCYHRMMTLNEDETIFCNFPLSDTLRRIMRDGDTNELMMGQSRSSACPEGSVTGQSPFYRPFLRLACQQSVKHWQRMNAEEHHIHGLRMYTRSLVGAMALVAGDDDTAEGI